MLTVEESHLPLTITVPGITDAQFQELCERYENYSVEYTAEGELLVMPPTDPVTDRRNKTHAKMQEWIANGALLGWMIDPKTQTVTIYRPGCEPETRTSLPELAGKGPVAGFVLDLTPVWEPV